MMHFCYDKAEVGTLNAQLLYNISRDADTICTHSSIRQTPPFTLRLIRFVLIFSDVFESVRRTAPGGFELSDRRM